jgi:hypothetical protein
MLRKDMLRIGKETDLDADGKPIFALEKDLPLEAAHEFWRVLRGKGYLLVGKEIALSN